MQSNEFVKLEIHLLNKLRIRYYIAFSVEVKRQSEHGVIKINVDIMSKVETKICKNLKESESI